MLQSLFALLVNLLPLFPRQPRDLVNEPGTIGEIINRDVPWRHSSNLFRHRKGGNRRAQIDTSGKSCSERSRTGRRHFWMRARSANDLSEVRSTRTERCPPPA